MTGSRVPDRARIPGGAVTSRDLAVAARTGDGAALSLLVTGLQPLVFRWALVFTADPDEADDVTQEAFMLMYRRLGQYGGEASFEGWMYRITRRVASQRGRTRRRRARLAGSARARPEIEAYHTDPGARVDRERLRNLVLDSLDLLPTRQREMFDLVDLQGLTPGEAAELTGSNPSTVRAHLFKARATIRGHLIAAEPAVAERVP